MLKNPPTQTTTTSIAGRSNGKHNQHTNNNLLKIRQIRYFIFNSMQTPLFRMRNKMFDELQMCKYRSILFPLF